MTVTVWTLTVEDHNSRNRVVTTTHGSEQQALDCLRDNYDPLNEFEDIQELLDGIGLIVYIERHEVEI